MKNFLLSLLIGLVAAVLDTAPMLMKKLDQSFIVSAFLTWLFLGIIIPHVRLLPVAWLNGPIVSLMVVIPVVCLVIRLDPEAVPVMLVSAVALGSGIGLVSGVLIR